MNGLNIIARSISVPTRGAPGGSGFAYGNSWQYHSRSDRHSKICCWAILFDLMQHCELLREHLTARRVAIGLNHSMADFRTGREKNLDLVICMATQAGSPHPADSLSFDEMRAAYTIVLSENELLALERLPKPPIGVPTQVLLAIEAKAAMTAFQKAKPRLYDELRSSYQTIHGSDEGAIAAGFALVNVAETFVSPDMNKWSLAENRPHVSRHNQPRDALQIVAKLLELPRRSNARDDGYDALAIGMVDCRNDGSEVRAVTEPPAPPPGNPYNYEQFITRMSLLYATRFASV